MAAPLASHTITKRRISWADFYALRPDLRPANDTRPADAIPQRTTNRVAVR